MGTFHSDRGEWHGFTVVAQTATAVHVGRCDRWGEGRLVLQDVETCSGDAAARAAFLRRARERGVWAQRARLVLPLEQVTAVRRLGEPDEGVGARLDTAPSP